MKPIEGSFSGVLVTASRLIRIEKTVRTKTISWTKFDYQYTFNILYMRAKLETG